MKKSYKKLILFEVILLLVFILNSFFYNVLSGYNTIIFFIVLLVIFKKFFGFEKSNQRYTKDILMDLFIFLLTFFILFYLLGLFIGFARTSNYYSISGFKDFIIPIVISIILKEILRYMVLKKSSGNNILISTTCFIFILFDITNAIYFGNLSTDYDVFMFIALTLLPAISTNISCSYISFKSGYKPTIVYLLVMNLYQYLIPIIPNPNEYLTSIIRLVLPILFVFKVYNFCLKESDQDLERDYNKSSKAFIILPTIFIIIMVYFTSGSFHYYSVAIASGSMEPKIKKGDVVIIEKINSGYDKIQVGQIIAFKYSSVIVVHRVIKIVEDKGQIYFYTKGDANASEDGYPISTDMIVGTVDIKIPYVGLPTVWLREI